MSAAERQEVKAVAKWVHASPRKSRLVVEHIRGRSVPEARTVLAFTQRAAARDVAKVLSSAVANAEANHNLVGDDLIVAAAYVDEGPVLKRGRARARGRAARIQKPTCHITIKLVEPERAPEPAPPKEDEKPAAKKAEAPKKKAASKRKTPAKKKEAAA